MTDILKRLGDDWHNPNPYVKLIEGILPSSECCQEIQNALLRVYEEEHFEFRSLKGYRKIETIYDNEIDSTEFRMQQLEEDIKKEDQRYKVFLEKFKKMEMPENSLETEDDEEEEEEEEEEDDMQADQKRKGVQKACKRSIKAEEMRKIQLAKGIKSSMASSQQKMIDLGNELELLQKKCEYYKHYQYASRCYISGYRKALREYSETKDVVQLVKNLDDVVSYYRMMMRRYVPNEPCRGEENTDCKVHLLPLTRAYNRASGFHDIFKCAACPSKN